jgi:hypothetical protein
MMRLPENMEIAARNALSDRQQEELDRREASLARILSKARTSRKKRS